MVDVDTITRLLDGNRRDLHTAARALIREANARGGDDNITAVLFEVAEGEPDDRTVESVVDADDEDTLHPGEAPAVGAAEGDTSIVSVREIENALAAAHGPVVATAPEDEARASVVQWLLAALVVLALVALIVFLVVRGLAR
jgi:hypothetical protein